MALSQLVVMPAVCMCDKALVSSLQECLGYLNISQELVSSVDCVHKCNQFTFIKSSTTSTGKCENERSNPGPNGEISTTGILPTVNDSQMQCVS
jgi:hypothetical protein